MAFYEMPAFYDMLDNALRQTNRAHNFTYRLLETLGALLSLSGMLALLWHVHPLAVLALVATTVPEVLALSHYTREAYQRINGRASARRMVRYLSELLTSRRSVKEMQIFQLHAPLLARCRYFMDLFIGDAKEHRFAELSADKTAIFVSHRFSTVRTAQQILVLEQGRLIEAGNHEELVALGGQYAQMFEMQAERYR